MTEEMKEQKPQKVEELEHFPFQSFDELKKRINEGVTTLGVDRSVALQWIQNGIYSSRWQRVWFSIFALSTWFVPIGLIVYIVITKTWLLFLALPLLVIGFFIFHPSQAMMLGPIRSGLILLVFGGLAWGLSMVSVGLQLLLCHSQYSGMHNALFIKKQSVAY